MAQRRNRISSHIKKWQGCQACPIAKHSKRKVLFELVGNDPRPETWVIGQNPDWPDHATGRPLFGSAGKDILRPLLAEAGLANYGLTNIIACTPWTDPKNPSCTNTTDPTTEEAKNCSPRLTELFDTFPPQKIILLGKFAKKYFPKHITLPTLEIAHPGSIIRSGGYGSFAYNRTLTEVKHFLDNDPSQGIISCLVKRSPKEALSLIRSKG